MDTMDGNKYLFEKRVGGGGLRFGFDQLMGMEWVLPSSEITT